MNRGKKISSARQKVDKTVLLSPEEAVSLMKEVKFAKFDETVEISIKVVCKSYQNIGVQLFSLPEPAKTERFWLSAKATNSRKRKMRVPISSVAMRLSRKFRADGLTMTQSWRLLT
jgi:ribosomal protein L1